MPEQWISDMVGSEARPRPGFEDELAGELERGWSGGRRPWRSMAWAAAAVLLVLGVVAFATRDPKSSVTPVGTTDVPSTTEEVPTSAVPPSVAGVTGVAIGGSVMLGAQPALEAWGVMVDARAGLGPQRMRADLMAMVQDGRVSASTTVVLHVGTDGPLAESDLDALVAALPEGTKAAFLTVHAPVQWASPNNALIRSLPTRHANVSVLDWDKVAVDSELCADGFHVSCTRSAAQRYADLVRSVLPVSSVPTVTVSTSGEPPPEAFAAHDYLVALAEGNFDAAAALLNEGGLEIEARADVRPLFRPEFGLVPGRVDRAALARALEKWCAQALCVEPTLLADLAPGGPTRVVFPYGGGVRSSLFQGSVFEGHPAVSGVPPMMPKGRLADPGVAEPVVDCPTQQVSSVTWADLDGDGWLEQLVAQIADIPGDEGGSANYTVTTCGTTLRVAPFEITGDGLIVDAVSPGWVGPDDLLIGFSEGYAAGGVYAFDGQRIVQQRGVDAPATFALHPPLAGQPGESVGCAGVTPDNKPELVHYTYRMVGGSDLSNSTAMEYTKVNVFGQRTLTENGTLTLPAQEQEAGRIVNGTCNDLPVLAH